MDSAPSSSVVGIQTGNGSGSGHVRIYNYNGTVWTQLGADINGENQSDNSGNPVSLSSDGNTVAIAAANNNGVGHVRVYNYNGFSWIRLGEDIDGEAAGDGNSMDISLSSNGTALAIGASYVKINGSRNGRVKIYNFNGKVWSQTGTNIDGDYNGGNFGRSISLSSDGKTVAVGAFSKASTYIQSGQVRIYNYSGSSWVQLGSDINGKTSYEWFGYSISLSSDGYTIAVSGGKNSNGTLLSRIYNYNDSSWGQIGSDYSGSFQSISSNGKYVASSLSNTIKVYDITEGNKSPTTEPDALTVEEDSSLTSIDVIANDSDEDGDELSLIVVTTSGSGTVAVNDNGLSVDYIPQINFNGTEVITYTVSDGSVSINEILTVTVNSVNDPVIASNVSAATLKNTNATIHLVASDVDFDDLTYTVVTDPVSGTVNISGDKATYVPESDVSGTVTFTYKVNDGTEDSETKTVTVKIIDGYLSSATQIGADIDGEAENDLSGNSISFNEDATIMAIGALSNDGNGSNSGSVRVYQYSSDSWAQLGSDIDGELESDFSGGSVSLSSNGKTIAIGATANDQNGEYSGHVRIYSYNGTTWAQLGADIDGEAAGDNSGSSVSLSSDGSTVAIGAKESGKNEEYSGDVRIYSYNGTSWTQLGEDIDGEAANDKSGYSVSLSSNGTIVAIGAPFNNGSGAESGHVRIYSYNGTSWAQLGADIDGEAASDQSGYSVSLSSNGTRVAISANKNDGNGDDSGHVRIYSYNGNSWSQLGSDIDGEAAGDNSGYSVSLSSDGNTLAVGAYYNNGSGTSSGHVRIYSYNATSWVKVGSDIDGEAGSDRSGVSVSLSSDGTNVAIGARYNDGNGADSGHVRVYDVVNLKSINLDIDKDGDSILDDDDNCPNTSNTDQADMDSDGIGDVCDDDKDGDGINNSEDNCPDIENQGQADMDGDGIGDVCDDDKDGDTILNDIDNCPDIANTDQADMDGDGIGDICDDDKDGDGKNNSEDNCPDVANANQSDMDGDGIGDVCDDDKDGDGKNNSEDNCPDKANADQADMDGDGIGDVCDEDKDGDTILNDVDNCPINTNTDQADDDKDGIGNVCDPYFNLVANNNKVAINRATCIGASDGSIGLSIEDNSFDYSISVTGKADPILISGENKTASVNGLAKGSYTVCFKVIGQPVYEQCFDVFIGEPKALSAFIDVDNANRTTNIQLSGSLFYNIEVNGERFEVKGDKFNTTLPTGLSIIKISTDLDCQGVIEREIFISEDIFYYPNPTKGEVDVFINGDDKGVKMSVFSTKGDLVFSRDQKILESRKTELDLSGVPSGTYLVTLEGATVRKTFKIVKK